MFPEREEFRILRLAWAPHAKLEENERVIEILRDAGFGVLPIPVEGLVKPELTINGRTFRGLHEISQLEEVRKELKGNIEISVA